MSYRMPDHYVCPECGNEDLQIVTETNVETSGKNFSAGKGCLGFLLFGPFGALCGLCGKGKTVNTTTTTSFMCNKCGAKFPNPKDLEKTIEFHNGTGKRLWYILAGVSFIVSVIPVIQIISLYNEYGNLIFSASPKLFELLLLALPFLCFGFAFIHIGKKIAANARDKYDELARKMNYFIDKKKLENENKDENNV